MLFMHYFVHYKDTLWHTWVGRMAVSSAERGWSKEPRIETMLSVMVWLLWSDSFTNTALCRRASMACDIPIEIGFLSLSWFHLVAQNMKIKNVQCFDSIQNWWLLFCCFQVLVFILIVFPCSSLNSWKK